MPIKAYQLVDWVYEKHIFVCHGRRTFATYSIALLSFQNQYFYVSNICKIGPLSELKIILFVISIAYDAKQNICTYGLDL